MVNSDGKTHTIYYLLWFTSSEAMDFVLSSWLSWFKKNLFDNPRLYGKYSSY